MRTEWHATGRLRAAMPPLRLVTESQQVRVGRARGAKYLHAQDARLGLGLGVRRHCAVPAVPRALHGAQLLPEVLALLQVAAPARCTRNSVRYARPSTAAAAHCPCPYPPPASYAVSLGSFQQRRGLSRLEASRWAAFPHALRSALCSCHCAKLQARSASMGSASSHT